MFKIKIQDVSSYKDLKKTPYLISYESTPDISKGASNRIYHEVCFSSSEKAQKFAGELCDYLTDCYLLLDLVYTKLKLLEISLEQEKKYLKIDFNEVEKMRFDLLRTGTQPLEAYKIINKLKYYTELLKQWCFHISKRYDAVANQMFKILLDFEQSFINTYRSAKMLAEANQLKLFL